MSSFTEPLVAKKLTGRTWEIVKAFEYHVGSEGSGEVIKIPVGFITDFASTPRFTWILFPPDGQYSQAAVVHDFLYHIKIYSRKMSDDIFKEAMKVLGVGWWKRGTMYNCVRLFGFFPWHSRKPLING